MKKKILILCSILILVSISIVQAELITTIKKEVYKDITNEQIANYMGNTFIRDSHSLQEEGIHIYYNYTAIQNYNETHIGIYTLQTPTWISWQNLFNCYYTYTNQNMATCRNILRDSTQEYIHPTTNQTITSSYLQAYKTGIAAYEHAIELKNSLTKQTLMNQLMN